MTGDMGDTFRAMREHRQKKHQQWYDRNRRVIIESGLKYKDKGQTLLFRNPGKPTVDFYPSTGRWRVVGKNSKTYSGGAAAFLKWYEKQKG